VDPAPPPVVDGHAHLLGVDRDAHGCVLSDRMRGRLSTRAVLRIVGARISDPPATVDARYRDHLLAALDASPSVGRVVLLPLDGVYGPDGRLDEERTGILVPNAFVEETCRLHPRLVPACSVNPLRADALAELDRCAAAGAVLCKWIPAAMGFDPADPRCAPFLARLREHGMPLLSHVGTELALPTVSKPLGDLARLDAALDAGVRVIVPHAGSLRLLGDAEDWRSLVDAMARRPGLWIDDSALLMLHRRRRLRRLLETPEVHGRTVHGSDYPLPAQALAFADRLGLRRARAIASLPGAFERDLVLKRALGLPDAILGNANRVLRPPRTTPP
jgi:predicted TIM-barrel fold metal-dependent hydrolase